MKNQTLSRIGLAIVLSPLAFSTTVFSQASSSSWLEQQSVTNWNKPGASIPKASNNNSTNEKECQPQIRNPSTPEDRAVKAAGWTLYNTGGTTSSSSGVSLVSGQTNFDGMCRPLGYQEFVFVNGVFAGTISPNVMNARADGSLFQTDIEKPSGLKALFARYTKSDALCCASRISEVTYRIDVRNKKPLVVPIKVRTYARPRQ